MQVSHTFNLYTFDPLQIQFRASFFANIEERFNSIVYVALFMIMSSSKSPPFIKMDYLHKYLLERSAGVEEATAGKSSSMLGETTCGLLKRTINKLWGPSSCEGANLTGKYFFKENVSLFVSFCLFCLA